MALPTNILQTVQTYQESELAYLLNLSCFVSTANTRFKDFEKMEANLGDTVTFDLPPRYVTTNSLVATFQPSQQRVQNLTVDQVIDHIIFIEKVQKGMSDSENNRVNTKEEAKKIYQTNCKR